MYKIGQFIFNITGIKEDMMPENLKKFKTDELPEYHYHFQLVDDIQVLSSNFIVNKPGIAIKIKDNLETRYISIPGDDHLYGCSEEIDDYHTVISFNRAYINYLKVDTVFNSLLSLERRMDKYNCYVLHSSYIVYQNEAILFTAPSGTGKSTQADLWDKYKDIKIINGDRTLLSFEDDRFYGNGWPICGSSEICFNQKYPIKAIVMLNQGKVNEIKELSNLDKTRRLIQEITINYHNKGYLNNALNFIDRMISNIPIINLSCTISKEAVDVLDEYLKGLKVGV